MEKIKKILYWATLLPPIFDAFYGFYKGVQSIIELGKKNYYETKKVEDLYKFYEDEEID
jgi:hypothetical protein